MGAFGDGEELVGVRAYRSESLPTAAHGAKNLEGWEPMGVNNLWG